MWPLLGTEYLTVVDALNGLVSSGLPFRDAYRQMAASIEDGSYKPVKSATHTHQGSLGNLCLDRIRAKMDQALALTGSSEG